MAVDINGIASSAFPAIVDAMTAAGNGDKGRWLSEPLLFPVRPNPTLNVVIMPTLAAAALDAASGEAYAGF